MNFFDKLTKKTNQAYQTAKEKTVKLSEEIKLKNKISELKDKINKEYEDIGKSVYETMKNGEDASREEITPKCEEITRLNEEIEKAENEILVLKNIKKCDGCGIELSIEADFCSKCGKEQPKIEKVTIENSEEPVLEVEATQVENVEESSETSEENNNN